MTEGAASRWQGLLVSVRDADEAAAAVAGGAAVVDVKEPLRGPLGAADPEQVAACAAACGGRPWTMACGELRDADPAAPVHRALTRLPGGPRPAAAKAGCAGLSLPAWRDRFAAFAAGLPEGVEPVPVAYADWRAAASPDPRSLIAAAVAAGSRTLLIDTCDKAGPALFSLEGGRVPVTAWIAEAHEAGLLVAVAGRLSLADLPLAGRLGADVVAVRSAVCGGDRHARVERRLVAAATLALAGGSATAPCPEGPGEGP